MEPKIVNNPLIGEHEDGDVGADRRKKFFSALANAMQVCNRPSFGKPKPYRAIFRNHKNQIVKLHLGYIKIRQWFVELKKNDPEAFDSLIAIEKKWPETGWEEVWQKERGWV